MTPPSIDRIRKDDQLLDALGGRSTPSEHDELAGLLEAWVQELDRTPSAALPTRRWGRRLAQGGLVAGLALATVSVSSVATAVSQTRVPVLYQLGSMASGIFGTPSPQHSEPLATGTSSRSGNTPVSTGTQSSSTSVYGPPLPSHSPTSLPTEAGAASATRQGQPSGGLHLPTAASTPLPPTAPAPSLPSSTGSPSSGSTSSSSSSPTSSGSPSSTGSPTSSGRPTSTSTPSSTGDPSGSSTGRPTATPSAGTPTGAPQLLPSATPSVPAAPSDTPSTGSSRVSPSGLPSTITAPPVIVNR